MIYNIKTMMNDRSVWKAKLFACFDVQNFKRFEISHFYALMQWFVKLSD